MSIFSRKSSKEERATISGPVDIRDPRIWSLFNDYATTSSGVNVTPESSMGMAAVQQAVKLIAGAIGSLPLQPYRRLEPAGKEMATDHALYPILHGAPNPYMTPMTLWEFMMVSLLLHGNGYLEIERGDLEETLGLYPLPATRVQPVMIGEKIQDGIFYKVTKTNGQSYPLRDYQVLHIPGLGFDGLVGKSPIKMAREAVALGLASEEFASRFLANGARPSIALKMAGTFEGLSEDARKDLKESFAELHQGAKNAGRVLFLEEGMDLATFSIPLNDSQFIEQRIFGIAEIARIFGVPNHKLNETSNSTYSNIEMQNADYLSDCIRPWCSRLEQSITNKLFSTVEQMAYFAEFNMDALMRGDSAARGAFYQSLWQMGSMNANEARAKENMNPVEGGDIFYVPVNYMPAGTPSIVAPPPSDEPPPDSTPQEASLPEGKEKRTQSVGGRQRKAIRNSYQRVFRDAALRVARGERRNVMKAVKRFTDDPNGLANWLMKYYRGSAGENPSPHEAFIIKEMGGPMFSLSEALTPLAAEQMRYSGDVDPKVQSAVRTHLLAYAYRQSMASFNRLTEIVKGNARSERAAGDKKKPAEEQTLDEELDGQLEDWEGARVDTQSSWETVRMDGLVASTVFGLAGVTALVWTAGGNACEICLELDGTVVGIEQDFMSRDDTMDLGEAGSFSPSWNLASPPAHRGCECSIEPE